MSLAWIRLIGVATKLQVAENKTKSNMNEQHIREIIELVNKLQKLGCGVETDNGGQILVYTGLKQNDNGEIVVCE